MSLLHTVIVKQFLPLGAKLNRVKSFTGSVTDQDDAAPQEESEKSLQKESEKVQDNKTENQKEKEKGSTAADTADDENFVTRVLRISRRGNLFICDQTGERVLRTVAILDIVSLQPCTKIVERVSQSHVIVQQYMQQQADGMGNELPQGPVVTEKREEIIPNSLVVRAAHQQPDEVRSSGEGSDGSVEVMSCVFPSQKELVTFSKIVQRINDEYDAEKEKREMQNNRPTADRMGKSVGEVRKSAGGEQPGEKPATTEGAPEEKTTEEQTVVQQQPKKKSLMIEADLFLTPEEQSQRSKSLAAESDAQSEAAEALSQSLQTKLINPIAITYREVVTRKDRIERTKTSMPSIIEAMQAPVATTLSSDVIDEFYAQAELERREELVEDRKTTVGAYYRAKDACRNLKELAHPKDRIPMAYEEYKKYEMTRLPHQLDLTSPFPPWGHLAVEKAKGQQEEIRRQQAIQDENEVRAAMGNWNISLLNKPGTEQTDGRNPSSEGNRQQRMVNFGAASVVDFGDEGSSWLKNAKLGAHTSNATSFPHSRNSPEQPLLNPIALLIGGEGANSTVLTARRNPIQSAGFSSLQGGMYGLPNYSRMPSPSTTANAASLWSNLSS